MHYEGLITQLEPDVLENGVKWSIGHIAKNKPSVIDETPTKPFKILQDAAVKVPLTICKQVWEKQHWLRAWKYQCRFQ